MDCAFLSALQNVLIKMVLNIPQLSDAEDLTPHYVAKAYKAVALRWFFKSTPGQKGGYILSRPSSEININQVF